jgi:hypothetical protein
MFIKVQEMWKNIVAVCIISVALTGCATHAVISDLEEDKVKVQANGNDMSVIMAEANGGCSIHGRKPVAISNRCLDGYCINKEFLFACKAAK